MKKLLLSLVCIFMTAVSALATTVYFENTANWGSVYAYCWSPEVKVWPGTQVTSTIQASGRTFYAYEVPGAQQNIVFNANGGGQTKDLKVVDGAVYSGANTNSIDPIGSIVDGNFVAAGEVVIEYATIYVAVSTFNYPNCYIYSWSPTLFGDWPGSQMTKTTIDGTDYWSIKIDKREIEGVTVGGWKLNAGVGQAESVNNEKGTVFEDGKVYTLTSGTGTDLGVVVDPTDPWADNKLAIHGQLFGDSNWSSMDLTKVEDGVYELTSNIFPGNFGLKVMDQAGEQVSWVGGAATITEADKVYSFNSGDNSSSTLEGNYTITYNSLENTIKFSPYQGEVTDNFTYAVYGQIFGDENWSSQNLEKVENGVYELTAKLVAGEFGVKLMDKDGNQVAWVGGNATVTEENKAYAFAGDTNSSSTLVGNYTITYNILNNTITFAPYQGEIEEVITYGVHGTMCGDADWTTYEMTEDQGKWYITLDLVEGDFGIRQATNGAQTNWYSAPNGENAMDVAGVYPATNYGGTNWHNTLTGKFRLMFDPEAETLDVQISEGIEGVSAAQTAAPVYYNLQGMKVAQPVSGLYIVVRGNKVTKELVK